MVDYANQDSQGAKDFKDGGLGVFQAYFYMTTSSYSSFRRNLAGEPHLRLLFSTFPHRLWISLARFPS
jgi:hypothetical protein